MSEEIHQSIIMEDRKKINMTGVRDIAEYTEDTVKLKTDMGLLTLRGDGIRIESFNTETGELSAEGSFYALVYTDDRVNKEGFLSRIFK